MCRDKTSKAAEAVVAMMEVDGFCLDYSMGSLDMIDTRIEHFRQEGESSDSLPAVMTAFGMYVGEVILRTLGRGEWVEDTDGYRLEIDEIAANPIGKCVKRLDNGASDSVRAFAEVILLMANMPEEERHISVKDAVESKMADVTMEVSKRSP
jgi:hypothetical protein